MPRMKKKAPRAWWRDPLSYVGIGAIAIWVLCISAISAADVANSAGSMVKLELARGHCSGVHIGDGAVLTAWHCVDNNSVEKVRTDKGETFKAELLWANKTYDLAMVSINGALPKAAPVSCSLARVGQEVVVAGNPIAMNFIRTQGRVLSYIPGTFGYWRDILMMDVTVAGGNSGGPVYNHAGEVVGILVGGYSGTGFAIAVPGPTICKMLARV